MTRTQTAQISDGAAQATAGSHLTADVSEAKDPGITVSRTRCAMTTFVGRRSFAATFSAWPKKQPEVVVPGSARCQTSAGTASVRTAFPD